MNKGIVTGLVIMVLVLAGLNIYNMSAEKQKIGYINIQKVFIAFDYKKELEGNLKMVEAKRQSIIDSMEFQLKVLAKQLQTEKNNKEKIAVFETGKEDYFEKKKAFEEDHARTVKQYDDQIIKQMNQYVKNYGEKNNYKLIHGTDGQGSLMYADSTLDITGEVIAYINESFKGKQK